MVKLARKICNLPAWATTNYVFGDRQVGGLGLMDHNRDADIQTVTQAIRMLSSPDNIVRGVTTMQLTSIIRRSVHHDPTEADLYTRKQERYRTER